MEAVSQVGTLKSFTERRPRVMLEWDSAQNKVVAPRSQVGLSWSQTSAESTKTFGSHWQARLVDGFDIPDELLELPDLNDILSAEVDARPFPRVPSRHTVHDEYLWLPSRCSVFLL